MNTEGLPSATPVAAGPMRVAVTGGSGLIGSHVVQELVRRGHEVINLDRRSPHEKHCRFVYIDLRDRTHLQPIFEQVDAVIHLGELASLHRVPSIEETFSTNTTIASTVFQTAADLKLKRLVYASTCQTYGFSFGFSHKPRAAAPNHLPFDETHPLNALNAYSASKVANEAYARMIGATTDLSIAVIRFPAVFGMDPSSPYWKDLAFRNRWVDGMGTYLHATDAATAAALAVEQPRPGCEIYHVAADETCLARPLTDFLREFHPDFPALPSDWPEHKCVLIRDKIKSHFGWEPKFNILAELRAKGSL